LNDYDHQPQQQKTIGLADILVFLKRRAWIIIVCLLIGIALALFRAMSLEPHYTAEAQILIDPKSAQAIDEKATSSDGAIDPARVEGQMAILRSENIAQAVIETLDLMDDPEFQAPEPSLLSSLRSLLREAVSGSPPDAASDPEFERFVQSRVAIAIFQRNLSVRRVGTSYAISIAFTSRDPKKAANIANAVADVYIGDQIKTAAEAARRTSRWLEQRISEARKQLNEAARAVQLFRSGQTAGRLSNGSESSVTLAELESRSEHYQKVYESYLEALTNSLNRESLPVSDARIITRATRPLFKSSPRTKLILAFGGAVGLLFGIGLAFLRHSMDSSVQSARQLRERLGLPVLAQVPRFGKIKDIDKRLRLAALTPFSGFTGSLKLIRNVLTRGTNGPVRVVGVTSVLPGEGKTTISANLAALLSASGRRVLLIDADVHQATISKSFAPQSKNGIADVLTGAKDLEPVIVRANENGFAILPQADHSGEAAISYDALCSDRMRELLAEARKTYDHVIIDMPPLGPVVDAVEMSSLFDGVAIAAEWGKTPLPLIEDALQALHSAQTKVLGIIITKIDPMLERSWKKNWFQYYGNKYAYEAKI